MKAAQDAEAARWTNTPTAIALPVRLPKTTSTWYAPTLPASTSGLLQSLSLDHQSLPGICVEEELVNAVDGSPFR